MCDDMLTTEIIISSRLMGSSAQNICILYLYLMSLLAISVTKSKSFVGQSIHVSMQALRPHPEFSIGEYSVDSVLLLPSGVSLTRVRG